MPLQATQPLHIYFLAINNTNIVTMQTRKVGVTLVPIRDFDSAVTDLQGV
jgi:hypothetical protein